MDAVFGQRDYESDSDATSTSSDENIPEQMLSIDNTSIQSDDEPEDYSSATSSDEESLSGTSEHEESLSDVEDPGSEEEFQLDDEKLPWPSDTSIINQIFYQ